MYYVFSVLIVIVAVLLVLIVMVQNSKGGGLAANFSSSNQAMGVRKTTDFLEKATWTLAIALLVFSIGASLSIGTGTSDNGDSISVEDKVMNEAVPGETPNFNTPAVGQPAPTAQPAEEAPVE